MINVENVVALPQIAPSPEPAKGCAALTVKATVKPKSITTNPFNHAGLGGLLMIEWALRNLKPKSKIYKASDRDGMYVTVSPGGTVTFRYDYRLHGSRETLTFGRYGPDGISLAMARELLLDARKTVLKGIYREMQLPRLCVHVESRLGAHT